jgi:hypothetical protein
MCMLYYIHIKAGGGARRADSAEAPPVNGPVHRGRVEDAQGLFIVELVDGGSAQQSRFLSVVRERFACEN